jgi:TetR/AcrR family transcriptional repressor of nem operon
MQVTDTRTAILDAAQELLQTRGFNAFSIKDLAERVQIRTSSIHYHFPTKADLCRALISRHRDRVAGVLAEIDQQVADPKKKLQRFSSLFRGTIQAGNRMCPFGMLAADSETLESGSCEELRESFNDLESWLRRVLLDGRKTGVLAYAGSAMHEARLVLSTLEGALLVARTYADPTRFEAVANCLFEKIKK